MSQPPVEDPQRSRPAGGLLQSRYPEISASSVIFAIILGAIMNAAITYAGLKIGFTIGGSAIAAVLGFGVLRGILRRGTILETNIAQTVASAVNTTNAGIIFTVPALMLLGHSIDFRHENFWWITLAATAGSILGVAFIVPLRKQMLDIDRLRFPSATAVGAILKSPGAGPAKSLVLLIGVVVAMLIYLPVGLPGISFTADLADLDALVARERITPADAALTRQMHGWIQAQQAPPNVIEQGRLQAELRDARLAAERDQPNAEQRVKTLAAQVQQIPADQRISAPTAIAAHEASQGQRTWASLRSREFGWATKPLWGYQDVGIRLPARRTDDGALRPRVDRDGDGRPDIVVTDELIDVGRMLGFRDEFQLVFAIAPFALGAGYLTGRAGLMVLAGGILAYLVLNPLAYNMGWMPQTVRAHQVAGYALGTYNRPLGVGLLLGGALMGILVSLPAIREALKSMMFARQTRATTAGGAGARDEMGFASIASLVVLGMVLLLVAAEYGGETGTGGGGALSMFSPWIARLIVVLVAAVWIWFAGIIIAQCTGMTDWSPISGLSLLTAVLVLLLAGRQDVVSAVMIAAALCVAISCASDMMADLKTGYIVGAQPRRQQFVEAATVVIGPIIAMFTLVLIAQVNLRQTGIPIGPGTTTVAPQAEALRAVITGVQGGEMPYALYGLGALSGMLLGLGAFPGLGVLVGLSMYLPVFYILTYGIGCIINMLVAGVKGRTWAEEWGVPFCAGLIVGEAILQLVINGIVLAMG